jgi:hypothetical protein
MWGCFICDAGADAGATDTGSDDVTEESDDVTEDADVTASETSADTDSSSAPHFRAFALAISFALVRYSHYLNCDLITGRCTKI